MNDEVPTHQSQELKSFHKLRAVMKVRKLSKYCSQVTSCIKSGLVWSDLHYIFVLGTHGWQNHPG